MIIALNVVFAIAALVLIASGLAVIFGLMRVVNFAHGEFMMLGAFIAFGLADAGLFWAALIVAPLTVGTLSVPVETVLIRRLYGRPLDTILATWGLSIVIREAVVLVTGPQFRSVDAPVASMTLLGDPYPIYRLVTIALGIGLLGALAVLLRYSRYGLFARAVIENPSLAARAKSP